MVKNKMTPDDRLFHQILRDQKSIHEGVDHFEKSLHHLRFEGRHHLGENLKKLRVDTRSLDRKLRHCLTYEEKVLFPYLSSHVPRLMPVLSLLSLEHKVCSNSIGHLKRQLKNVKDPVCSSIMKEGTFLTCLIRNHYSIERDYLLSVLKDELKAEEKAQLRRRLGHPG